MVSDTVTPQSDPARSQCSSREPFRIARGRLGPHGQRRSVAGSVVLEARVIAGLAEAFRMGVLEGLASGSRQPERLLRAGRSVAGSVVSVQDVSYPSCRKPINHGARYPSRSLIRWAKLRSVSSIPDICPAALARSVSSSAIRLSRRGKTRRKFSSWLSLGPVERRSSAI